MKAIAAISALLLGLGLAAAAEEQLTIPADEFDFGLVPQHSTVKHHFWFKSTGSDTLHIGKITTGCTCALMPIETDVLAPGDSMLVGITWDVGRSIGKTARYPRVAYESPDSPAYMIVRCLVVQHPDSIRPVRVKPYRLSLSKTAAVDIDSLSFVLTNSNKEEDLALAELNHPVEECEYALPDTIPAGGQATGWIKIRPEYADKEFHSSITLLLNDERRTRITIPIQRRFF
jgi:hypothetical protein